MSGPAVLVVDDEPQILRALRTNLRGAGYTVHTAATAAEALAAAAARPPEAVILDLVLPDGHGTDVCRELRRFLFAGGAGPNRVDQLGGRFTAACEQGGEQDPSPIPVR